MRAVDSIEHIHPQNPNAKDWAGKLVDQAGAEKQAFEQVGRIGNLILLPAPINSAAKAGPFAHKKRLYLQHNLRMVKEVSDEDDWNLTTIEGREARIVEWAKSRWKDID